MSEFVRFETLDTIARMTLTRPEKLNAINDEMLEAMLENLRRVADDPELRVLIVSGEGRAFSAGGDIASMHGMDEAGFGETIQRYMRLASAFRKLEEITIAAINGYALAGGFELALLCDIRIAARSAVFGLPDRRLPFHIERITPISTQAEGRNLFTVEAQLDDTPDLLRPGMDGVGKIDIGERRLIWIWTHRLTDWLRLWAWSWSG